MFEELMGLSKSITSHALDSEMTWPNVTLPHFDVRATKHKNFTLEFYGFAPFVIPATRLGWEEYALQNQDWISQDYHYRGWNESHNPIPPEIHRYNESAPIVDFEKDMFDYEMPLWQVSPPRKDLSLVNLDLSSEGIIGHLLWDVKAKKVEQYSRVMDVSFLLGENMTVPTHPRGTIFQPVFEDFTVEAEVVGFTVGSLSWDYMFQNVLYASNVPLIVEIEGACNAKFTYKVTGTNIEFLGFGEGWRDTAYDKYKQSADLLTPQGSRPGFPPVKHSHRSTDASHAASHCVYVMNTYPTKEFISQFQNGEPMFMALVVGAVFGVTAMVFLLYDYFVQERQEKLAATAKRTNAIVSSLFPKEVQKRMMEEVKQKEQAMRETTKRQSVTKSGGMSSFLNDGNNGAMMGNNNANKGAPIADLFPSGTSNICVLSSHRAILNRADLAFCVSSMKLLLCLRIFAVRFHLSVARKIVTTVGY